MCTIYFFSGSARSGKDYIAEKLKEHLEKSSKVLKIAYADELKKYLCILFNINKEELDKLKNTEEVFTKNGMSMRDILQRFGTDVFVKNVDKMFWVKKVADVINADNYDNVIVTDMRFPHELALISYLDKNYSIKTVKIENSRKICADAHISENALNDFDFNIVIDNMDNSYVFNIKDF